MKSMIYFFFGLIFFSCSKSTSVAPKKAIEDKLFGLYLSDLNAPGDTLVLTKISNQQVKVYESYSDRFGRYRGNYTMDYNLENTYAEYLAFNEGIYSIQIRSKSNSEFSCDCVSIYKYGNQPFSGSFTTYTKKP